MEFKLTPLHYITANNCYRDISLLFNLGIVAMDEIFKYLLALYAFVYIRQWDCSEGAGPVNCKTLSTLAIAHAR